MYKHLHFYEEQRPETPCSILCWRPVLKLKPAEKNVLERPLCLLVTVTNMQLTHNRRTSPTQSGNVLWELSGDMDCLVVTGQNIIWRNRQYKAEPTPTSADPTKRDRLLRGQFTTCEWTYEYTHKLKLTSSANTFWVSKNMLVILRVFASEKICKGSGCSRCKWWLANGCNSTRKSMFLALDFDTGCFVMQFHPRKKSQERLWLDSLDSSTKTTGFQELLWNSRNPVLHTRFPSEKHGSTWFISLHHRKVQGSPENHVHSCMSV